MSNALKDWYSAQELADLKLPGLPGTQMGVRKLIDREGWTKVQRRPGSGGGLEYHISHLPEAARAELMLRAAPRKTERLDSDALWMRWDTLPSSVKAIAERRLSVIDQVEQLVAQGLRKTAAIELVVSQARREAARSGTAPDLSCSTVYGWFQRIAGVELQDRCVHLAPDYQGRQKTAEVSDDAYEHYKGYYLQQSRATHADAYRDTVRVAAVEGWTLPSSKTLQRRLEAEITPAAMAYLRYGDAALDACIPHRTRDRANLYPNRLWNLDGHIWDNEVLWPDGTIKRPVSVVVQDIASGQILAIRLDLSLNHNLVRLSLGDAFRQYGLPEELLMDNGRENTAAAISGGQKRRRTKKDPDVETAGLLKLLGVKASFASPYLGRAKPIERAFRNFAHGISKRPEFVGSYTGHNPVVRPENSGARPVPLAEFEAVVRREIAFYNAQEGRRGLGMNGRSFEQAYAEGIALHQPRRANERQLRLCMLASKEVTMHRLTGEVTIDGHRYWSTELGDQKRQRVVVRFDPNNMALPVHVYSLDGRYLAEAGRTGAGNFDNQQDGREARQQHRDIKRAQRLKAKATRKLEAMDVAARSAQVAPPTPAPEPASNVVSPVFGAPRRADQLGQPTSPSKEFDESFDRGAAALMGLG